MGGLTWLGVPFEKGELAAELADVLFRVGSGERGGDQVKGGLFAEDGDGEGEPGEVEQNLPQSGDGSSLLAHFLTTLLSMQTFPAITPPCSLQ